MKSRNMHWGGRHKGLCLLLFEPEGRTAQGTVPATFRTLHNTSILMLAVRAQLWWNGLSIGFDDLADGPVADFLEQLF